MKVALNNTFGGFCLEDEEKSQFNIANIYELYRDDPRLVQAVETIGDERRHYIADVPDDAEEIVLWEYDGMEWLYYKYQDKWHCYDGSSTKGIDPISRKRCKHGVARIWLRLKAGAKWSQLDYCTTYAPSI